MFISMFFNKKKVFVQDADEGFFEREYQDNIKDIIMLENDEELLNLELQKEEAELEDILEVINYIPKRIMKDEILIILIMIILCLIGFLNIGKACIFGSLLVVIDLIRMYYKYDKNNKNLKGVELAVSYLKSELAKTLNRKQELERNKTNYKYEDLKAVNLTAINNEKRYLLKRKLELIKDYMANKKYYQNLNEEELKQEFPHQELKALVRELKQIK